MNERKPSIALIGMRGAGKTVVGRELAGLLHADFLDTDEEIALRAGQSIAGIFRKEGKIRFRHRERQVITEVCAAPPRVISVGGGAVLDEENVKALQRVSIIVWLTAPVEVLYERIVSDVHSPITRPRLTLPADESSPDELKELRQLLTEREARYSSVADLVLDTVSSSPRQIAERIVAQLRPTPFGKTPDEDGR